MIGRVSRAVHRTAEQTGVGWPDPPSDVLGKGDSARAVKFRYEGTGTSTETASCVFQGDGIGDHDASQNNVPTGGEFSGQIDAFMMDVVFKTATSNADVHVQCFGPSDVHIINTQFLAIPATSLVAQ